MDEIEEDEGPEEAAPGDAPAGGLRELTAAENETGLRIDAMLAAAWPDLSRARIQGLIGANKLTADGAPVKMASEKTRAGVTYALELPPPAPAAPQPEAIPLTIAFEDEHLLVIDKASGMAMHPAPGAMTGTLVNAVLAHCANSLSGIGGVARPGIVHRIDKDTTGLVVVAKHDAAHAGLAKLFAAHDIERVYYAVTRGAPQTRTGVIDAPLARSHADRRKMVVTETGKRAVTHYWTIESFGQIAGASAGKPAAALLECRLETGRTHQIRAHLADIGAPLLGDPTYGKFRGLKVEGAGPAADRAKDAARDFPRQALHAAVLGFTHPITGQTHRFESQLPEDLQTLITALRAL